MNQQELGHGRTGNVLLLRPTRDGRLSFNIRRDVYMRWQAALALAAGLTSNAFQSSQHRLANLLEGVGL